MELKTHTKIDTALCGEIVKLDEGYAKVLLGTSSQMAADEKGLVHGGFAFGAADFAAMAAVNDPYVVLAGAECRFLAPVIVGDEIVFEAGVKAAEGKKCTVRVEGHVGDKKVFEGIFKAVVPPCHILDARS